MLDTAIFGDNFFSFVVFSLLMDYFLFNILEQIFCLIAP